MVFAISICINILMFMITTQFLKYISLGFFICLIYLLPIILNGILTIFINKKTNINISFMFPTISFVTYYLIGFKLSFSSVWHHFVMNYSQSNGDIYIKITENLISVSQLIFVIILYFGVEYLVVLFIKRKRG